MSLNVHIENTIFDNENYWAKKSKSQIKKRINIRTQSEREDALSLNGFTIPARKWITANFNVSSNFVDEIFSYYKKTIALEMLTSSSDNFSTGWRNVLKNLVNDNIVVHDSNASNSKLSNVLNLSNENGLYEFIKITPGKMQTVTSYAKEPLTDYEIFNYINVYEKSSVFTNNQKPLGPMVGYLFYMYSLDLKFDQIVDMHGNELLTFHDSLGDFINKSIIKYSNLIGSTTPFYEMVFDTSTTLRENIVPAQINSIDDPTHIGSGLKIIEVLSAVSVKNYTEYLTLVLDQDTNNKILVLLKMKPVESAIHPRKILKSLKDPNSELILHGIVRTNCSGIGYIESNKWVII